MNRSGLGASYGVLPVHLQINSSLAKWTVFWSETFLIKPGLVNWTEFCVECPIGGERGGVEGFSLKLFQMDPDRGCGRSFGQRFMNNPWLG